MAIGVSGTNSNSTSVQIAVGPAGVAHNRSKFGLIPSAPEPPPIESNNSDLLKLMGCFDPGNIKCYSGGGTSATDFVSGINYTITGNANADTVYKTDNLGIIEITGNGHIRSNGSYSHSLSPSNGESNAILLWFWPATGATQEEALFQFRHNDNGTYENGVSVTRLSTGNGRTIRLYAYSNNGEIINIQAISNAIWQNTWNHFLLTDLRVGDSDAFRLYYLNIKSPFHELIRSDSSLNSSVNQGNKSLEYDVNNNRELTICKANGITGTFRGKIGCVKIYRGTFFNFNVDSETPPEEINGYTQLWKAAYESLAPRYDQYD